MEIFFQWETYIALLTLTMLEIILGIDKDDGVIRLSMTHYNSENDTVAAISALDKIK